ncbi:MAG: pyrroline-5-carboxylate reductase [Sphingomonadales bacterium]|jgi:pyrroline-5-carboxylate reductase
MGGLFSAERPVVLLGCGNMGKALLKGWIAVGIPTDSIIVIDPAGEASAVEAGLPSSQIYESAPENIRAGLLMAAVKPQVMAEALGGVLGLVDEQTLLLSIAAGTQVQALKALLPKVGVVVRAMPNTPCAIGEGITVACADSTLTERQEEQVNTLLSAGGEVRWVGDEGQMDAVTALSGSGPAYVFHLIECLAAAGEGQGLGSELARDLALYTVAGAGRLAKLSDQDAQDLRRAVTSPGGTTQAGLEVLMGDGQGLSQLIRHTIAAAAKRSRELSK